MGECEQLAPTYERYQQRFARVLAHLEARSEAALSLDELSGRPNDAGVTESIIPAGRCALLRHAGSDDHLDRSIRHLYSEWLPGSNEEPRDFPLFMQRVAFYPDVPDSEAVTDIYLPLR